MTTYILISTDFKNTKNKIGDLDEYVNTISSLIESNNTIYQKNIPHRINCDVITGNSIFDNETDVYYEKIRIEKQEEFYLSQIHKKFTEEHKIITTTGPFNYITKGSNFIAMIINTTFIQQPYLHMAYAVLKYDLLQNKYYFDIFVSTKIFNPYKTKLFIPKFFVEGTHFDEYKNIIYNFGKISLFKLLNHDLKICYNLYVQNNIVEYFVGNKPIDDNVNKYYYSKTQSYTDDEYLNIIVLMDKIIEEKNMFDDKKYILLAFTKNLLNNNIYFENSCNNNNHAEELLMGKYCNCDNMIKDFNTHDTIYVVRKYHTGVIGNGLPCNRCMNVLFINGIKKIKYSVSNTHYNILNVSNEYTYTTSGNKIMNMDKYLYSNLYNKMTPFF